MPEPEYRSEYIVAETDDERKVRLDNNSRQDMASCKYIVAQEGQSSCEEEEGEASKYETVEAREDEDAVVIVTRRK